MDAPLLSLDEIEALDVRFSDLFAKRRGWEEHQMTDPIADLELFFGHIPGKRMLDVGCGWARYVGRFLDQGLEYVGIDHSSEMLKLARESFPYLQFIQASYRDMSQFADASFDGLWCCCIFGGEPKGNMPDVLEELGRVLVTGGIMMVIMPATMPSTEEFYLSEDDEPSMYHSSYELPELEEMLKQAGFEVVESVHNWQAGAMSVLVRK